MITVKGVNMSPRAERLWQFIREELGIDLCDWSTDECVMQNVEMKVEGKKLVITVDLDKTLGRSASGKSGNIATTAGNKDVPGVPGIKIGLNVYRPV